MSFASYEEAVNWIVQLQAHGIKPGLKRMEAFMEKLGHPQRKLKCIHVAGTNGKGSTCAMISTVLRQSGYDVGSFTSPYIEKFTERIQLNGQFISEDDVWNLANRIKPLADEIGNSGLGYPTMFEITTVLALLYFAEIACPYFVVLETGLGGRLDCTNIVVPLVSVITNIGYDHTEVLGDTIELIATEKAGIIKSGVPVISTVEQPEAISVIEQTSHHTQSAMYQLNRNFSFAMLEGAADQPKFTFQGPFRDYDSLQLSLIGAHQFKNAAAAIMTLEVLRQYYALIMDSEDLRQALTKVKWPGRLELLRQEPAFLVDGAHNPEGAIALAEALRSSFHYERMHFMIGMMAKKHHRDYFRHILPIADTVILTEPSFRGAKDCQELFECAGSIKQELGLDRLQIIVQPDWQQALAQLQEACGRQDLAVATGSLYLVADVRSWLLYQSHSEKGW